MLAKYTFWNSFFQLKKKHPLCYLFGNFLSIASTFKEIASWTTPSQIAIVCWEGNKRSETSVFIIGHSSDFPHCTVYCSLQNLHQTSESNTYFLLSKSQQHREGLQDNTKSPAVVSPERNLPIEENNGTYTVWKEAVVPLNITSVKADANQ